MIATRDTNRVRDMILNMDFDDLEIIEMLGKDPDEILNLPHVAVFTVAIGGHLAGFFATGDFGHYIQTPIFLKKEFRGMGHGKRIVSLAERQVRQLGVKYVLHKIRMENLPMIALSKKCGYQEFKNDGEYVYHRKAVF